MTRPARLCSCGQIVLHGASCPCQLEAKRERDRRHDARRPSSTARGYNGKWRKMRVEYLRLHPCCAFCGAPSTVVDHKTPHRGDPRLFWSFSNWQALCQPCHDRTKQRLERAARAEVAHA